MIKLRDLSLAKRLIALDGVKGLVLENTIDIKQAYSVRQLCTQFKKEFFIDLSYMLLENETDNAILALKKVKQWQADAFLYTDLGFYELAKKEGLTNKAFYDGGSLLTNSLDASFYLSFNKGVVLARELTLDEIKKISTHTAGKISLFIGGFLTMSFSRRHYLSSYFAYRNKKEILEDTYLLKEIKREDYYPIQERKEGTYLFTEGIYLPYQELAELENKYDYGFFDTNMLNSIEILTIVNDLITLNKENAGIKLATLKKRFAERVFDTGYLYRKTNVCK